MGKHFILLDPNDRRIYLKVCLPTHPKLSCLPASRPGGCQSADLVS